MKMKAVKTHEEFMAVMEKFLKTEHAVWVIPVKMSSSMWTNDWVFTCNRFSAGYTASENSLYFRRFTFLNDEEVLNFFSGLK